MLTSLFNWMLASLIDIEYSLESCVWSRAASEIDVFVLEAATSVNAGGGTIEGTLVNILTWFKSTPSFSSTTLSSTLDLLEVFSCLRRARLAVGLLLRLLLDGSRLDLLLRLLLVDAVASGLTGGVDLTASLLWVRLLERLLRRRLRLLLRGERDRLLGERLRLDLRRLDDEAGFVLESSRLFDTFVSLLVWVLSGFKQIVINVT